ncbi:hypothetical protein F4780DRAFT_682997 [Xylariomycetidae sp. FL0641]|nr:hypothetical protein F4780DRAFT_682997 [Xylariomycetidae sp. FL0641]
MAAPTTLPALLDVLTQSLSSALEAAPKVDGIDPPEGGVSLLDVKNELLLSYLQNLVFLILIKIRNAKANPSDPSSDPSDLNDTVVKKLVELRLYLDKGVRPLEEKLRFQLDKVLRAADDADRNEQITQANAPSESESGSDSDADSDAGDDEAQDGVVDKTVKNLNARQYGPQLKAFTKPAAPVGMAAAADNKTGVYRPPRIAPTVMPDPDSRRGERRARPMKSATMDEYVSNELSTAPVAQPSVGTNVVARGRKVKTTAEREAEDARREYEETNFVRLPKESKKDRAQRAKAEGRSGKMSFGGEDWRDLGEGVDRIEKLTRRKEGGSGGTRALLEKSRKRGRDTIDSGRGSGLSSGTRELGDRYNKKVKVMESGRRDRGRR